VTRHLTHRFWLCFSIGWGGLVVAVLTRNLDTAALGAPFLAALALSLADGWWPTVTLTAARANANRVVEGDEVEFTLTFQSSRPALADIEVQLPGTFEPVTSARSVQVVHGQTDVAVRARAVRWGASGPEWVIVITRDRLGVSERILRCPIDVAVRVHPPAEHLSTLIPLYRERPVTGEHRSKAKGAGSEFAEVRPYRYGDSIRMIHPQLTARRGTPMVIERHPDRSSTLVLLVDSAQDLGVGLETTLRWTVTAAMALGARHLQAQDRLGLLDVGHQLRWVPARLGRRHLHTVVDSLLATEVQARQPKSEPLRIPANLPSAATIVTISPLLSEGTLSLLVALRGRGHEIIVIKPTVPEPADDVSPLARRIFTVGNQLNEQWLHQRGAVIIPWAASESLQHILSRVIPKLNRGRINS